MNSWPDVKKEIKDLNCKGKKKSRACDLASLDSQFPQQIPCPHHLRLKFLKGSHGHPALNIDSCGINPDPFAFSASTLTSQPSPQAKLFKILIRGSEFMRFDGANVSSDSHYVSFTLL